MKKWMVLFVIAAIGSLFMFNQLALAESCQQRFQKYDLNRDGLVTLNEFQASFDKGQYAGTVPTPSGKKEAFAVFESLGGTVNTPINLNQFCSGRWGD